MHQECTVATADGDMTAIVQRPESGRLKGAIVFFHDAGGMRQTLYDMAARMSTWGYVVVLPDLYYRTGKLVAAAPDDPKHSLRTADGKTVPSTMGAQVSTVTNERAVQAAVDVIAWLDAQPDLAGLPVGLVGYCMGGPFVLATAGALPDRVRAGGALYGVGYITDENGRWLHIPDKTRAPMESIRAPSRLRADENVARIKGEMLFVYGGTDPFTSLDEIPPLHALLERHGVRHTIDVYEGAGHAFAFRDRKEYDAAADERHFASLKDLFARTLG